MNELQHQDQQGSGQVLAYSIKDACRVSSLGRTNLYALLAAGALDSILIGKRRLIPAESLKKLIREGA